MTQKQRSELDAAIERATKNGVEVMGHGHMKGTNDRVFLVPSQRDPERHWHIVRLTGCHLICDCESKVICCHRAAAHMELVTEAAKREYNSKVIERELNREAEKRAQRDAENDRRDEDRWELIEAGNW